MNELENLTEKLKEANALVDELASKKNVANFPVNKIITGFAYENNHLEIEGFSLEKLPVTEWAVSDKELKVTLTWLIR